MALGPAEGRAAPGRLVELGRSLFSDRHLSADGQVSCATCHDPSRAFTDGRPVALGVLGRQGTRNSPSLRMASQAKSLTWDGRRTAIEDQIRDAFLNPRELGLENEGELQRRLGSTAVSEAIAALAAYVRTLSPAPAAFDRYRAGDKSALGPAELRGYALFTGRARCAECHVVATGFTDHAFHRVDLEEPGLQTRLAELVTQLSALPAAERFAKVPLDPQVAALGRFVVTLDPRDISTFRTPSLRDVARTAPYFHDGSVPTLEAAVDREIYYRNDESPLVLNPAERADLVAFLHSLTGQETP